MAEPCGCERRLVGDADPMTPMPTARDNFATAVLHGQVYVAGWSAPSTSSQRWRFTTRTPESGRLESLFLDLAPRPVPRCSTACSTWPGAFPVGVDDEITNSMIVYDRGRNTWRPVAPMSTARIQLRLVAAGRYLYAIGGRGGPGNGMSMTTVERYDPRSNSWRTMAPMRERRAAPCVVDDGGQSARLGRECSVLRGRGIAQQPARHRGL